MKRGASPYSQEGVVALYRPKQNHSLVNALIKKLDFLFFFLKHPAERTTDSSPITLLPTDILARIMAFSSSMGVSFTTLGAVSRTFRAAMNKVINSNAKRAEHELSVFFTNQQTEIDCLLKNKKDIKKNAGDNHYGNLVCQLLDILEESKKNTMNDLVAVQAKEIMLDDLHDNIMMASTCDCYRVKYHAHGSSLHISKLDLSDLHFTRFPKVILSEKISHYLRVLNLSNNQLLDLPEGVGNMQHLAKLFVNGNALASLPDNIDDDILYDYDDGSNFRTTRDEVLASQAISQEFHQADMSDESSQEMQLNSTDEHEDASQELKQPTSLKRARKR